MRAMDNQLDVCDFLVAVALLGLLSSTLNYKLYPSTQLVALEDM